MLNRPLLVAAAPLLAACSSPFAAPPEVQGSGDAVGTSILRPPATQGPKRPVITKLVMRDIELVIWSSAEGPRFSVENQGGALLAGDLGEAELKTQFPAVYELYRAAVVRTRGPYLDATLTRSAGERIDRP